MMFRLSNVTLGTKRGFGDLDDDEDDIFGSKKVCFVLVNSRHFFVSTYAPSSR